MAYDNHVSKTRTLVQKWNLETTALQKILCYCNVWLSEKDDGDNRSKHNDTQFQVCRDQTHLPSSVDYGTSEFITQEYDGCPFVDTVVPCTEATTAAGTTV